MENSAQVPMGRGSLKSLGRLAQALQPMEETLHQIENATHRIGAITDSILGVSPPVPMTERDDHVEAIPSTIEAQINAMCNRFARAGIELRDQVSRLEEM